MVCGCVQGPIPTADTVRHAESVLLHEIRILTHLDGVVEVVMRVCLCLFDARGALAESRGAGAAVLALFGDAVGADVELEDALTGMLTLVVRDGRIKGVDRLVCERLVGGFDMAGGKGAMRTVEHMMTAIRRARVEGECRSAVCQRQGRRA